MCDVPNPKAKRNLILALMFMLETLAGGATLAGCSGWTTSTVPQDSAVTHFGYTGCLYRCSTKQCRGRFQLLFRNDHSQARPQPALPSIATAPFPPFPLYTLGLGGAVCWMSLEFADGQYDWTTMDGTIAVAQQNGVRDFVFTLSDVPQWASTNPADSCGGNFPGACDAPDMRAFDDFVTHVVQRYCGVVRYYETWNEPNLTAFWNGTNAQLLLVARDLYQIANDPANCGCTNGVCSPGGGVNPNQVLLLSLSTVNSASTLAGLDAYLAAAGPIYPYADVVAFHGYGYPQPEGIAQGVVQLRQILAKHALSQLELWDTEASWGFSTTDDQQAEASWLMRFHIAQAVSGVSRFVWYAYDNCAWGMVCGPASCVAPVAMMALRFPFPANCNSRSITIGAIRSALWGSKLPSTKCRCFWTTDHAPHLPHSNSLEN